MDKMGDYSLAYDNDTGIDDDSFSEWWDVKDKSGETIARTTCEKNAQIILSALNARHDDLDDKNRPEVDLVLVPIDRGPNFSDSTLPFAMIDAGMSVLEKADEDLSGRNGEDVPDWDYGMETVAVYRAMIGAAPAASPASQVAPIGYLKPESQWAEGSRFVYAKDRTEDWMLSVFTIPVYASPLVTAKQSGDLQARALDWIRDGDIYHASTEVGLRYSVHEDHGRAEDSKRWVVNLCDGVFPSPEAAMTAAQDDWNRRIAVSIAGASGS